MSAPAGLACLILAAGRSQRMPGRSKLALEWGDTTVLGAVVRSARRADLSPVVVVGSEGPAASGLHGADRILRVPDGGRADSLAAGLAELPSGPLIVLLGDEPEIRSSVIQRLCRAASAECDAARIRYEDRPGHPVWLGPAARAVAGRQRGDESVWEAIRQAGLRVRALRVDGVAPIDVDCPAAFASARARRLGNGAPPGLRGASG